MVLAIWILGAHVPPAAPPTERAALSRGDQAPRWILDDLEGNRVNLRDFLSGGPHEAPAILVSLYATWCEPCRKELPFLIELHATYAERGLRIFLIGVDEPEQEAEFRRQMAESQPPFPVLLDQHQFVWRRHKIEVLPGVVLMDRRGVVAWAHEGFDVETGEATKREIEKLL